MARIEQIKENKERHNRFFSKNFKRAKVEELEKNPTAMTEICKEYQVSRTSVYKWIYEFSKMRKKGVKQVVEAQFDTRKLLHLQEKIK